MSSKLSLNVGMNIGDISNSMSRKQTYVLIAEMALIHHFTSQTPNTLPPQLMTLVGFAKIDILI